MHPIAMLTMLVALTAMFCWSANRRWQLLKVGRDVNRLDRLSERLKGTFVYAFLQKRMPYYMGAGLAHMVIFFGFLILLLRTLMLWGRGFDPQFNMWLLGPEGVNLPLLGHVGLGHAYDFAKDIVATIVFLGAAYFFYLRVFKGEPRMTRSAEAVGILIVIMVMMVADMAYDGAAHVLYQKHWAGCSPSTIDCASVSVVVSHLGKAPTAATEIAFHPYPAPAGSLFAVLFAGLGPETLEIIAHVGFWTHATLVMVFLNFLPHGKHFHVITAIPNVLLRDLEHPGKLSFAGNAEALGEKVMAAFDDPDNAEPIGITQIEHFTWKDYLDFYTCTECGRCSDNCPAHRTGKILSPKQFTIDLRDHLYQREEEFLNRPGGPKGLAKPKTEGEGEGEGDTSADSGDGGDSDHHEAEQPDNPTPVAEIVSEPIELLGNVIHEDVLWACTTCRACEEICPVMITYVDKIVDMRRNLVLIKGEFPQEMAMPFQGMEGNSNPWNLSSMDRAAWAEGLDIKTMAEHPETEVLLWIGCAASFDDRAKKIARSTAKLLQAAGVDFAILGEEEGCSGDPARRAGNEYLFAMLAELNVATLNGYQEKGGAKTIVAACPHCFNTLGNEYPDFGGNYEMVHHSDYLLKLVAEGKLTPTKRVKGKVVFHDSCYLGRYNEIYDEPRELLRRIPGVQLVEPDDATRQKGLCCGAGGMQMFMEEQNKDRMNVRRTLQLLDTGAATIAPGCPFCVPMLTDGLKDQEKEDDLRQLDIAELLEQSCDLAESKDDDE